jgi:hypothetical protein
VSRHSGRYGKIYIGGTAVASIDSWKLSLKRKTTDVTCFGDANEVQVVGLPNNSGSFTGFWDDTDTVPFTEQAKTTYTPIILYADYANQSGKYAYGPAWLDMSFDVSVGGAVKISGDFSAAGSWANTFGA